MENFSCVYRLSICKSFKIDVFGKPIYYEITISNHSHVRYRISFPIMRSVHAILQTSNPKTASEALYF